MAIDGQGKFLFILNGKSNNISMFQIDQASGALSEVPASPFQVPPTINPNLAPSQPISIAAEKSGKFLFVGYFLGDIPGLSAVVSLAIDTSGLSPVLVTQHSIQTNTGGAPAQLLTDPKGLHLYVGLSQGQNKLQIGGAEVYSIDPASVRWATWAWPTARRQWDAPWLWIRSIALRLSAGAETSVVWIAACSLRWTVRQFKPVHRCSLD